jgi:hypothetical protein
LCACEIILGDGGTCQLVVVADALRNGLLNSAQTESVRALREGLGLLGDMEDVKVLSASVDAV